VFSAEAPTAVVSIAKMPGREAFASSKADLRVRAAMALVFHARLEARAIGLIEAIRREDHGRDPDLARRRRSRGARPFERLDDNHFRYHHPPSPSACSPIAGREAVERQDCARARAIASRSTGRKP
jgi:hypothetical protein